MSTRSLFNAKAYDDINVTPMLDVAYVLLIIFIILTTATVQGIQINLPKASNAPSLAEPKTKAITITNDGTIYLDTFPVSEEDLAMHLAQLYAVDPNLPVIVKGDAEVAYQQVVRVLDICGEIGISQIGLVTKKIVK
jgi:biopolymer transport protein ExbD